MIQSGTVALAKTAPRFTFKWLVCSAALFLLQYVYPAAKIQIEASYGAAAEGPDAVLAAYILDGTLSWFGLLLGFMVSGAMYRLALAHWRDEQADWPVLAKAAGHLQEYLSFSFAATVFQQVAWFFLGSRLPPAQAVLAQLVLVWLAVTPFVFVVPLVVDHQLNALTALSTSWRKVSEQPLETFLFVISAGFWSMYGAVFCFVGVIATLPTYQLAVARAYLDLFSREPREPAHDTPQ